MKQLKELIEASILGDIDTNINDVDKYLNDAEQQLTDIKEQILKKPEWETWQESASAGRKTFYVNIFSVKEVLEYLGITNWSNWSKLRISIVKYNKIWTINISLHDFPKNKELKIIELSAIKYNTFDKLRKKFLCEEIFKNINTFSKFIKDNYNK